MLDQTCFSCSVVHPLIDDMDVDVDLRVLDRFCTNHPTVKILHILRNTVGTLSDLTPYFYQLLLWQFFYLTIEKF